MPPDPNPLSPETVNAIREAVDQLSTQRQLSAETRAELSTHLEDKTRAYLTGEQPLSEIDAFLLAKLRLGNPQSLATNLALVSPTHIPHRFLARLKSAFSDPLPPKFAQRLAWTAIALISSSSLAHIISLALNRVVITPLVTQTGPQINEALSTRFAVLNIIDLLLPIAIFSIFLWITHRLITVQRPRVAFAILSIAALLLLVFSMALPFYLFQPRLANEFVYRPPPMLDFVRHSLMYVYPIPTFVLWLWWSCRRAINLRRISFSYAAWITARIPFMLIAGYLNARDWFYTPLTVPLSRPFHTILLMEYFGSFVRLLTQAIQKDIPTAITLLLLVFTWRHFQKRRHLPQPAD